MQQSPPVMVRLDGLGIPLENVIFSGSFSEMRVGFISGILLRSPYRDSIRWSSKFSPRNDFLAFFFLGISVFYFTEILLQGLPGLLQESLHLLLERLIHELSLYFIQIVLKEIFLFFFCVLILVEFF